LAGWSRHRDQPIPAALVAADIDHLAPTSRVAGCAQGVPIIPATLLRSALGYEQPLS
jgi:hypothetical protein